ncbi:MAG TPA: hypothetical protein VFP44_17865 [Usitatibacter sp.]|nr:hypothetical protein [Usitatibacter sp.]
MELPDKALSAAVAARIQAARARLSGWMERQGLREQDGWRVSEELRSCAEGTQFVYRPIHLRLPSPQHEEVVLVDSDGVPC